MQYKLLAISTLATALMVGCTSEQKMVKKDPAPAAKAKAKPALMHGASARMLAETCEGCHGTEGNSFGPAIPSIAGMSEDYLIEAMEDYRSGDTKSTIMGRIIKGYSEEEVELMAQFYASKTFIPAKQSSNKNKAKKGKALHKKYCEKCHSEGGTAVEDDTGLLAGQWIPYLQYSFEDYANNDRSISKKMKKKLDAVIAKDGHAGIESLIHYYGSQK
ncbi:MAG: cytochrome c4 [Pseudomonadota bacterium]